MARSGVDLATVDDFQSASEKDGGILPKILRIGGGKSPFESWCGAVRIVREDGCLESSDSCRRDTPELRAAYASTDGDGPQVRKSTRSQDVSVGPQNRARINPAGVVISFHVFPLIQGAVRTSTRIAGVREIVVPITACQYVAATHGGRRVRVRLLAPAGRQIEGGNGRIVCTGSPRADRPLVPLCLIGPTHPPQKQPPPPAVIAPPTG